MMTRFTCFVALALLIVSVQCGKNKCKLSEKKMAGLVEKFEACRQQGYKSTLDNCKPLEGNLKLAKKENKKCKKVEKTLKKCDHACVEPAVDGGWTDFGNWTECSATCGGGNQTKARTCTNPAPANGGAECVGDDSQSQDCNTEGCPVDGEWTDFGNWTECSATCGGGTQTKTRTCTNPAPANGGAECYGDNSQSQSCNTGGCPGYCSGDTCYRGDISYTVLKMGESLTSSNGKYSLRMQGDGNLVIYCSGGKALWASDTDGDSVNEGLVFQADSNLVLYNSEAIWSSGTDGDGASRLVMQNDGNLVLYKDDNSAAWNTETNDKC